MIPIVFNIDKKYIPYFSVTVGSILKNSSKDTEFNFYVLSFEELQEELNKIRFDGYNNFKIINKIINTQVFEKIQPSQKAKHITFDGYLHAFIPKVLTNIDKCIHLDCDLILNEDISNLYNHNLGEYFMAGVISPYPNYYNGYINSHIDKIVNKYNLVDGLYFNIGVKLLNLKEIRDKKAEDIFLDQIKNYVGNKDLTIFDQDLLNIVYRGGEN